jgi:hypothetical protein
MHLGDFGGASIEVIRAFGPPWLFGYHKEVRVRDTLDYSGYRFGVVRLTTHEEFIAYCKQRSLPTEFADPKFFYFEAAPD